jgi:universal stress protein A
MHVYRNVLAAIDCSPADALIIEHVTSLARQLDAKVHLLHVVHSHTLDQDRSLREIAISNLNRYRGMMQAEGIDVHVVIRSGEPESEILKEIEENSYDLLAMATHGHRLPERILFGSVSRAMREKISIPLLLINGDR